MENTRAKGEIDDISDNRNKNRRTFFKTNDTPTPNRS